MKIEISLSLLLVLAAVLFLSFCIAIIILLKLKSYPGSEGQLETTFETELPSPPSPTPCFENDSFKITLV